MACAASLGLPITGHPGSFAFADQFESEAPRQLSPVSLRLKRFEIPFSIDSVGQRPTEVHLYVSRDAGKQWIRSATEPPSGKAFLFDGGDDGEYWFATRTIDASGSQHPDGPIVPQLHVRIDTTDPQVDLFAELGQDGNVNVEARCVDRWPSRDQARAEYSSDIDKIWRAIPGFADALNQVESDRWESKTSFEPSGDWHTVSIRVIAKDEAGNQTIATHQIERPRIASAPGQLASSPLSRANSPSLQPSPSHATPGARPSPSAMSGASNVPSTQSVSPLTGPYPQTPPGPPAVANVPIMSASPVMAWPVMAAPVAAPGAIGPAPGMIGAAPGVMGYVAVPGPGYPVGPVGKDATLPPQTTAVPSAGAPARNGGSTVNVLSNPYAVKAMETLNPPPPFYPASTPAMVPPAYMNYASEQVPAPVPDAVDPNLGSTSSMSPELAGPSLTGPAFAPPALTGPMNGGPETGDMRADAGVLFPGTGTGNPSPLRRAVTPEQAMRPLTPNEVIRPGDAAATSNGAAPRTQTSGRPSLGSSDPLPTPPATVNPLPFDAATSPAPVRHSRSRKFSLDYEVESAGRAGVEEVELWGTTDQGTTWKRWGADPDRQTPFDIETNNDGVYGFCIVVVAKNGLATPRPLASSPPDIFVVVDTMQPVVRITGATYGEGDQTGSLLIRYSCSDENLASRPISLSFSDKPTGPWTTIAAGLENSGGYAWPADPQLPRQIYLRIDATDAAGNNGAATLEQAIDVQGLAPRARIRGFNPITGTTPVSNSAPQTATVPSDNPPAAKFK